MPSWEATGGARLGKSWNQGLTQLSITLSLWLTPSLLGGLEVGDTAAAAFWLTPSQLHNQRGKHSPSAAVVRKIPGKPLIGLN